MGNEIKVGDTIIYPVYAQSEILTLVVEAKNPENTEK
jgi:hypothetical protein